MDVEKVKEMIIERLLKHKNCLRMAIKEAGTLLDEIDVKIRLEESDKGKISYKDFGFICDCDPSNIEFLDVGNGTIFCNQCGRMVFVEACCEHCQNVYNPKVDSCKYHICKECLLLAMREAELNYENWKRKYLDIIGKEWENE